MKISEVITGFFTALSYKLMSLKVRS